jgi:hypothetical protein
VKNRFGILLLSLFFIILVSCSGDPVCIFGSEAITNSLLSESIKIERISKTQITGLSIIADEYLANGDPLYILDYGFESYKSGVDYFRMDAFRISLDGNTINGREMNWQATPHFYRCYSETMAIYIGDDEQVKSGLRSLFRNQFAGGE